MRPRGEAAECLRADFPTCHVSLDVADRRLAVLHLADEPVAAAVLHGHPLRARCCVAWEVEGLTLRPVECGREVGVVSVQTTEVVTGM